MVAMVTAAPQLEIQLRDYQLEQLKKILAAKRKGRLAALVVAPTGSGKTLVMVELARRLNVKTVILAHREKLLNQTRRSMLLVDPQADIGIVGFGLEEWGHQVTLGGVQTLRFPARLARLAQEGVELVIVDEVHHDDGDNTYATIRVACQGAFVVGFTATPKRLDGREIESFYGAPVFERHILRMIREKWLSDLKCVMLRSPKTSLDGVKLNARKTDYDEHELERAINRTDRNQLVAQSLLKYGAKDDPTLVFCTSVQHARDVCAAIRVLGIKAACVFGETPDDERDQIEDAYATGRVTTICNVDVYGEGADLDVRRIVLAAPTKSSGRMIQQIGRGTRLAPGKAFCWVIDVTDNCLTHSLEPLHLDTVLDVPLKSGQSAAEADAAYRAATNKNPEEDEENPTAIRDHAPAGEVVAKRVTLGPIPWQRLKNGGYKVDVGRSKVVLWPAGRGQFHIGVVLQETVLQKPRGSVLMRNMPMSWAQTFAEQQVRKIEGGQAHLVDPDATWRSAPASDAQVKRLMLMRVKIPPNLTKGQASDLMSMRFAKGKQARSSS